MVFDNVHEFIYKIYLSEDVDLFNVILQIQIDIRFVFEYIRNEKTIIVLRIDSNKNQNRLKNVSIWQKYGSDGGIFKKFNNRDISGYDCDEDSDFINTIKDQQKLFNMFTNEFQLLDSEKDKINGIINHPLLQGLIIEHKWDDICRTI